MSEEDTDRRGGNEGQTDPAAQAADTEPPKRTSDPADAPPAASIPGPPADPRIGETLVGRYRLERLIGKGGMGRVYLATQHPLNRQVAVKILSPEFQAKDPQFVRRFFLEAATAARLNHPNTITIFDYGETERGELFIAMEYLRGRPLSRVIAAEPQMPASRTLHIAMQIARALREAHAKGIIHRDLKPGNIMLLDEGEEPDFAKVLDFGLVKLFTPEDSGGRSVAETLTPAPIDVELTRAGMFLGSPKYMSPEQIQNQDLDPRTDVYSLGIIMYQMISGRVPFRGESSVEIIYKHVHSPVPPIHDLNPEADAPPELEVIVQKCLAKKREDRFLGMAELLIELKQAARNVVGGSSSNASLDVLGNELRSFASGDVATSFPPGMAASGEVRPSAIPFVDRDAERDDTPGSHPLVDVRYARRRFATGMGIRSLTPYLLAAALVLGIGAGAYWISSRPAVRPAPVARETAEKPPPPVEPAPKKDTRVAFESNPPGAEVFEGERRLGETPFEASMPSSEELGARRFIFRKAGHLDETVEQAIDGDRVKIVARLREAPPPVEVVEPEPEAVKKPPRKPRKAPRERSKVQIPEDFKENPY